jgi:hypothetical protein
VYEMIVGFSPFRSEKIYEWSGLTKKDKVGRPAAHQTAVRSCLCLGG